MGELPGHTKQVNACDIRPSGRPFRAVTGGDDALIGFYHGVPFKFNLTHQDHSRFVNDVRYAPSGDIFASAGADGKVLLFDGKTADTLKPLAGHQSGVYSLAWSPDSKYLLTSSADATAKLWDVETSQIVWYYLFSFFTLS